MEQFKFLTDLEILEPSYCIRAAQVQAKRDAAVASTARYAIEFESAESDSDSEFSANYISD